LAAAALIVAACAGPSATATPTPSASATTGAGGPTPASPTPVKSTPAPRSTATFCPGRTWPPYRLVGIPGLTAVSTNRATIEISNHTARTYYYRVSAWELAQFESCRAFGEVERQRGPIAPGATESVMVDPGWQQEGRRVTIALWDKPCGEACTAEPVAAMVIELSPLEPASS
jgi:hypothetical protein